MIIVTSGVTTNEYGHILLMQRNDSHTWALPGGGLETGELPTIGVAREVREETGIIVLPVRLVSLTYILAKPEAMLSFTFRCIQRGGELSTSTESLQVGWFQMNNLPRPMLSFQQHRLETAFHHKGGAAILNIEKQSRRVRLGRSFFKRIVYPFWDWRRKQRGEPVHIPAPSWQIKTTMVLMNKQDHVLWQRPNEEEPWRLPTANADNTEAPWSTAVATLTQQTNSQIRLSHLSSVLLGPNSQQLTLNLVARTQESSLPNGQTKQWAYFASSDEPTHTQPDHVALVANGLKNEETTTFNTVTNYHG